MWVLQHLRAFHLLPLACFASPHMLLEQHKACYFLRTLSRHAKAEATDSSVFLGTARRNTTRVTRPEDEAYVLLSIFGVNMPILYGEGAQKAFFRLQVMIFQIFPDHSIFTGKASVIP
jgi:hypothetical protein